MGRITHGLQLLALAGVLAASQVQAQSAPAPDTAHEAEQLRRLDIMLMVTALRCRFGADDFQADYAAFSARHLQVLNEAGRELQGRGGVRQLDRISTTMANRYGTGHPWLDCAALKAAAQGLAATNHRYQLLAAADELLAESPRRSSLVAAYSP